MYHGIAVNRLTNFTKCVESGVLMYLFIFILFYFLGYLLHSNIPLLYVVGAGHQRNDTSWSLPWYQALPLPWSNSACWPSGLTHVPIAIRLFFSFSWGMYLVQHFVSFFAGVDGCRNPNILFICPMFRLSDDTGELQQIQQQLLQASPKRHDRDDHTQLIINSVF